MLNMPLIANRNAIKLELTYFNAVCMYSDLNL